MDVRFPGYAALEFWVVLKAGVVCVGFALFDIDIFCAGALFGWGGHGCGMSVAPSQIAEGWKGAGVGQRGEM